MPSKNPRDRSSSILPTLTERRCLGFGPDHTFQSTGPENRRCRLCEVKFQALHIAGTLEEVFHIGTNGKQLES